MSRLNHEIKKLHDAVNSKDVEKVKQFLQTHSHDVKELCQGGALNIAARNEEMELLKVMLEADAPVDNQNSDGMTALMSASSNPKNYAVVNFLLSYEADVNIQRPHDGYTALHIAADRGCTDIVKELIKKANVNMAGKDGMTPLCLAAQNGMIEAVQALASAGADINIQNGAGNTPLYLASQFGKTDTVKFLLARSAKKDIANNEGWTALHKASQRGKIGPVDVLIHAGCNVKTKEKDGFTALHLACQNGHKNVVTSLIGASAEIDVKNNNDVTPLYLAAMYGHSQVVHLLLLRKAKVNLARNNGMTPLHAAVSTGSKGQREVIDELLLGGADPKLCDHDGNSSFDLAKLHGVALGGSGVKVERDVSVALQELFVKTADLVGHAGSKLLSHLKVVDPPKEGALKDRTYGGLLQWKTEKGDDATEEALIKALRECGLENTADKLEKTDQNRPFSAKSKTSFR